MTMPPRDNRTAFNGSDESGFLGFPSFGRYEEKKKRLAEERKQEYTEYLERKHEEERLRKERQWLESNQLSSMDYLEILRRKKEEEMRYRNINGIEDMELSNSLFSKSSTIQSQFADNEELDLTRATTLSYSSQSSTLSERFHPVSPNLLLREDRRPLQQVSEYPPGNEMEPLPTRNSQRSEYGNYLLPTNPMDHEQRLQRAMSHSSYTPSFGAATASRRRYLSAQAEDDYTSATNSNCWERDNRRWDNNAVVNRNFLRPDISIRSSVTSRSDVPRSPYNGRIMPPEHYSHSPYPSSYVHENPCTFAIGGDKVDPKNVLSSQQQYRTELEQQIEERKARKMKEKQNEKAEEEKLAQRVEMQRLRIQKEFEEEQKRKKLKEEDALRKREMILQAQAEIQRELEEKRRHQRMRIRTPVPFTANSLYPPEERIPSPPLPVVQRHLNANETIVPDVSESVTSFFQDEVARTATANDISPTSLPEEAEDVRLAHVGQLRRQLQKERNESTQRMQEQEKPYRVLDKDSYLFD